ncbi:hypothetical protein ABZ912_12800 [Nonomuraea angiospora]|uniref:hypothetical protein n=1 Tax=Nonomuraea angiospora TaxID=46172 RepID=UPI0033F71710
MTTAERDTGDPARSAPPQEDDGLGGSRALGDVIVTAIITAAVVPFVQTLMTKAAEDSYAAARSWLRRQFKKGDPEDRGETLLIVKDPDPGVNVTLYLKPDASDEALRALEHVDMDAVAAEAKQDAVTKVQVYWDESAGRWRTELRRRRDRGN